MKKKELPRDVCELELILEREGFENPNLEARLLWEHLCSEIMRRDFHKHLREHLFQIYQGLPVQRQIGYTEVMGKKININKNVLLPGPEIEILLNAFFDYARHPKIVVDLCTGCGVLASIIGERFPWAKVYATDISYEALEVAKTNICSKNVEILQGDLFVPLSNSNIHEVDVIISNPPYCKTSDIERLPKHIRDYTPRIAIDGGEDGYFFHRKIIIEAQAYLRHNGLIILENEVGQSHILGKMFSENGYKVECVRKNKRDEERVIVARRIK